LLSKALLKISWRLHDMHIRYHETATQPAYIAGLGNQLQEQVTCTHPLQAQRCKAFEPVGLIENTSWEVEDPNFEECLHLNSLEIRKHARVHPIRMESTALTAVIYRFRIGDIRKNHTELDEKRTMATGHHVTVKRNIIKQSIENVHYNMF